MRAQTFLILLVLVIVAASGVVTILSESRGTPDTNVQAKGEAAGLLRSLLKRHDSLASALGEIRASLLEIKSLGRQLHARLDAADPMLDEPPRVVGVQESPSPAQGIETSYRRVYDSFDALPADVKERIGKFFDPEPPPRAMFYVSEWGYAATMPTPPEREPDPSFDPVAVEHLTRAYLQLHGEALEIRQKYIDTCLAGPSDRYMTFDFFPEAGEYARSNPPSIIQEPRPGVYVVLDLAPLVEQRPDYALLTELADTVMGRLVKANYLSGSTMVVGQNYWGGRLGRSSW